MHRHVFRLSDAGVTAFGSGFEVGCRFADAKQWADRSPILQVSELLTTRWMEVLTGPGRPVFLSTPGRSPAVEAIIEQLKSYVGEISKSSFRPDDQVVLLVVRVKFASHQSAQLVHYGPGSGTLLLHTVRRLNLHSDPT